MFRLYAGALLDRPPGPKYVAALPFAELTFPGALPKTTTLQRWRESMPEGFECSLVAPKASFWSEKGPLREGRDLDEGVTWLTAAREAMDAHLVVPTTSALTTSSRDRARLEAFFGRLELPEGRHLIWSPGGLWEAELAHPFAAELDVICAYDPLQDDPPEGEIAYARLAAIGGRRRFGEELLLEALDALTITGSETAYVAIDSPRAVSEATNLLRIAAS